jgi:hypothetical protein
VRVPLPKETPDRPSVFLSYSRTDASAAANYLYQYLSLRGVDVYRDVDLPVGDSIQDQLTKAIRDADYVVVLISPAYSDSRWTSLEVGQAFRSNKRVIPVLVEACDVPSPFNQLNYLDWTDQEESSLRPLVEAVTA